MLKQVVAYTDFNDQLAEETIYFNLTKTELADNLYLKDSFEALQAKMEGPEHSLSTDEIMMLLDLVKTMMRLSYGIRSEDGKRFKKSDEIWTEFQQTAVYDAYLFSLFEDPNLAVKFMVGILPSDLREAAEKSVSQLEKKPSEVKAEIETTQLPDGDLRDLTREELLERLQSKSSE